LDTTLRDGDELPTYWTPKLGVSGKGCHNPCQALKANCVGARQQLRVVLDGIISAKTGSACEERLIEVFIIYRDCFYQGATEIHPEPGL